MSKVLIVKSGKCHKLSICFSMLKRKDKNFVAVLEADRTSKTESFDRPFFLSDGTMVCYDLPDRLSVDHLRSIAWQLLEDSEKLTQGFEDGKWTSDGDLTFWVKDMVVLLNSAVDSGYDDFLKLVQG